MMPTPGRMIPDAAQRTDAYLFAARDYVCNLGDQQWLYSKPLHPGQSPGTYFQVMYPFLNLLEALHLSPGARVLEVGCGPGWMTEILVGLGFHVTAIDPAPDMIAIAQERVQGFVTLRRLTLATPPEFQIISLEAADLPENTYDAILFFETLHHIIDEKKALATSFRVLKPGGMIGIGGEGAWIPGNATIENFYREERDRYGTLENLFTPAYLDEVLKNAGFTDITAYHSINGFVPVGLDHLTVRAAAQYPATSHNHRTARKPDGIAAPAITSETRTGAGIDLLSRSWDPSVGVLQLEVEVTNAGLTRWPCHPSEIGRVTFALVTGPIHADGFQEPSGRIALPHPLRPGEKIRLSLRYDLPPGTSGDWRIEPVAEQLFWFAVKGSPPLLLSL